MPKPEWEKEGIWYQGLHTIIHRVYRTATHIAIIEQRSYRHLNRWAIVVRKNGVEYMHKPLFRHHSFVGTLEEAQAEAEKHLSKEN